MQSLEYRVPLAGSERAPAPGFHAASPASPSAIVDVTVVLRPRPGDEGPGSLDEMARLSPMERHYLSREEYAAAHSADSADINKLFEFAARYGLKVVGVDEAAHTLYLRATVAAMNSAFGVALTTYRGTGAYASQSYRGRTGPVYIPVELDGIVQAVMGLDNRPQARPFLRRRRQFGGAWSGPGVVSYTPDHIARHYNFPAGQSGAGQCIGIVALQGGYSAGDLQIYFERLGIAVPRITAAGIGNAHNSTPAPPAAPNGELAAAIQVAGAVAPGAHIVLYIAPPTVAGLFWAITRAVYDPINRPSVVSISWGAAEAAWTPQSMLAFDRLFRVACAMGITVCCATGDRGSSDGIPGRMAHATFPASSPHVLACGGTVLSMPGDEATWNDGPGGGAGGGGISEFFPRPGWQRSAQVPPSANPGRHLGRGLPDVAANAGPMTGYRLLVNGLDTVVGGTSVVSPLWAGLIALLNQKLSVSMGFFNPLLYARLAGVSGALRDITTGDNDMTGLVGAYRAGPGWDACTGWGTPDGTVIAAALD